MKQLLTLFFTFSMLFCAAQTKEEFIKKAAAFAEKKDFENSLKQVDMALALDSTNEKYLLLKANNHVKLKQFQEAFNSYSKLITLYPTNVIAISERAVMLSSIQEYEYALQDFDKALGFYNPDSLNLMLYVNRGATKISIRDFKGAYDDFMAAYKIDSMDIGTLNNLATVCDEVGKGDQTLKYLHKILSIDSSFVGTYVNIGFKYQEMGNYKKAIQYFDKAISMDANEPLSYSNRSYNRLKLGDLKGAMTDIEKSIELYPANSYAFRNRALIYIEQKKIKEACADLAKATELGFTRMYGDEVDKLTAKYCKSIK
jgi:tetratricopeptide (TPR) repeat protein